jgi:hypothetical protein
MKALFTARPPEQAPMTLDAQHDLSVYVLRLIDDHLEAM